VFCLKKIMAFVLSVALIAGIIVPTFLVTLNISAEEAYTGVIDNGGSEEMAYPFVDGGNTATNIQDSSQVHSGDYSTKIVAKNSGMNASFRIESTTNYNEIPLNKEVYITFWAKADETTGFKGAIFTGNVYQTGENGASNKLDNYMNTYAIGSGSVQSKWENFSKEWKQYFIKVQKPFEEGYTGCYSFIKIYGKGTFYIDDFDIVDPDAETEETTIIDNAGSEKMPYPFVDGGNTATNSHDSLHVHSGDYSTKIVTSENGMDASFRLDSTTNYSKIPLNKQVYISFWAKADETAGFKGAIFTGNVYQTGKNGASNKLDNYTATYAVGSATTEDGWEELSKEWKQYYIKVQKNFEDGYTGFYSFIKLYGKGTLYVDDFDIVELTYQGEDIIDNAGSEVTAYPLVYGGNSATSTQDSLHVHGGSYSTKVVTNTDGMDASFRIDSTTNYSKIPLNKEVYISFWIKADETVGFKGAMFSGNVYQTGENGISNKLDNYTATYAFGSGSAENGWVELSKEWKQYFIKVQKPFESGYTGCYSFINMYGKGTFYIDDFDIIELTAQSEDIIDNAGSEVMAYPFVNGGHTATSEQTEAEVHAGKYSTKVVTSAGGMDASFRIDSTTNYNKIPLNKEVYITFWAKADETTGFKGSMFTGNVYQTGEGGISNKLDNYTATYAAGSATTEDGWVDFPKEWKQYFIKVLKPFEDGYTGFYSYINMYGKGTFYIDDFDIIELTAQSEDIIDNAGSEVMAYPFVNGAHTATNEQCETEKHSGSYSTKVVTSADGMDASFRLDSTTNYSKIPLNKQVYITFWAKADENAGFKGSIFTGNVYQTGKGGTSNKLDNYTATYAAGSTPTEEGWVEFSKEWKQYYIKVQKHFEEGYTGFYSYINMYGKGTFYIDDFDIIELKTNSDDIIDNAGSEIYAIGEAGTPTEQTSDEAHSGNFSTKLFTNGSIKITSTKNYNKIPFGKSTFITFWAKADETVGFKGAMGTGNIYQVADDGTSLKLDGWSMSYAFGSSINEEEKDLWEEVPKEWTKYYIKVLHNFDIGYTSMYSYINYVGEGILYIDDFNIETAGGGSASENPLKVEIADDVIGARYYESTADGTFQIQQKIIIKNLTDSFESGLCEYTVTDSLGDEISFGDFDIAVGPQASSTYVVDCSSIAAYGTYTVDFSVTRENGSKYDLGSINLSRIKSVDQIYEDDMLGINLHYSEVADNEKEKLRETLKPLAAAGVNTVRTSFHWTDYETEKGVYNFTQNLKNYFEVCAEFNITVAPVLKESVNWAEGNKLYANGDLSSDECIEGYGNFCAAFIKYLGSYAKYALISNEPNYCGVPADVYTKMLKSAYKKIKAVNPDVKVVGAEVSGWGTSYIMDMLNLGAYDYMDAVGIHPYIYPNSPEASNVIGSLEEIAGLTAEFSKDNKPLPIWCDEYGYFTSGSDNTYSPVTEEEQAVYMTRYTAMMAASGLVEMAMPYVAYDMYDNYELSEGNYGIMRHPNSDKGGLTSKSAHLMIAGYMNALGGKKFKSILKNEADVFSYLFSSDDGANVYMLWDVSGDLRSTVTVSDTDVRLYDCFGNSKYIKMNENSLNVTIGQRPVYLVLNSGGTITDIQLGGTDDTDEDSKEENKEQEDSSNENENLDSDKEDNSSKDNDTEIEDEKIETEDTESDYTDDSDENENESDEEEYTEMEEETDSEEDTDEPEEEETKPKRKKKKVIVTKKIITPADNGYILIIIIAVSVVVLVGGGLGVFFIIRRKKRLAK